MEGKGLAFTETVALTTSAAAVGVGDVVLVVTGGGALFATGLDGAEGTAVSCAGCGWPVLLLDGRLDAGDELIELG
jgi:hypothetical protein